MLNSVQTWPPSFSAMCLPLHNVGMASPEFFAMLQSMGWIEALKQSLGMYSAQVRLPHTSSGNYASPVSHISVNSTKKE